MLEAVEVVPVTGSTATSIMVHHLTVCGCVGVGVCGCVGVGVCEREGLVNLVCKEKQHTIMPARALPYYYCIVFQ